MGTALLASPVLPWKIRPILSVFPPIPPSISDTQGEKRATVSALGQDAGLVGRVSHTICQPDAEHSWKNGEESVEAVEDSRIPPPLKLSGCLHI